MLFLVHAFPFPGTSQAIRFVKSFLFSFIRFVCIDFYFGLCCHGKLKWMILPVACQFASKNLSLSLQSNYFCWHPCPFTSFQMDLMSLSLSMRAFECLPLQDCHCCCCCCYFCLLLQHSHKPSKSHTPQIPALLCFLLLQIMVL